ncbi:DUF2780 domain-containing protein [Larsenimonas salina]|uniref:DUF2780 domain-containing protein n=1 Tax=Larsenimonas salina TaxID=1295565 RepID=UPI0020734618|nr:DUF2780 domain-containing protein [Larsenimonas salina]MCM5705253.1 DUF2780 domain-containing protein [Larsenimonas salina]
MKKYLMPGVALCIGMAAAPAMAFDLQQAANDAMNSDSGKHVISTLGQASQERQAAFAANTTESNLSKAADLTKKLSSELGVSPTQAVGGAASMLAMAKSSLSSDQFNQLSNQAPSVTGLMSSARTSSAMSSALEALSGNDSGGASGTNMLGSTFQSLGMDASMIRQFAPVMLSYFKSEGVSSMLTGALSSVWGSASNG